MAHIVIMVEMDENAPVAYVAELSEYIKGFRWVKDVKWKIQDDEGA